MIIYNWTVWKKIILEVNYSVISSLLFSVPTGNLNARGGNLALQWRTFAFIGRHWKEKHTLL